MSANKKITRRGFLTRVVAGGAGIVGAYGIAAYPLLNRKVGDTVEDFFTTHYKKLTPTDKEKLFKRIEERTKKLYGADVKIGDDPPINGVNFGYALNLTICIGCRKCVKACVDENNQSRDSRIEYIRVLKMNKGGGVNVEHAEHNYEEPVPEKGKFYMPIQCQQCDNPPCTKVCPVKATWKEDDGIVVIDYNWCIGCRYCSAACPYYARKFNYYPPKIKPEEIQTEQAYLGNRIRSSGVMEKCTFCIQRTRKGLFPACHEACPTGARKFGDLNDPLSEVREVIENKDTYVFKQDLGTIPKFYYYYD